MSRAVSSSIHENGIFDLRALAARLPAGFRQRDVVYAIEELSHVGLPNYRIGDRISLINAEIILAIGLNFDSEACKAILQQKATSSDVSEFSNGHGHTATAEEVGHDHSDEDSSAKRRQRRGVRRGKALD
jgi:hypothetical protein